MLAELIKVVHNFQTLCRLQPIKMPLPVAAVFSTLEMLKCSVQS